jgi:hypothetical protein
MAIPVFLLANVQFLNFHRADGSTVTQAAHIQQFFLMSVDTNKMVCMSLNHSHETIFTPIQLFKKATIWAFIKSFANIEFKELNGANIITLDTTVHSFFGMLQLCFEAVPLCRVLPYHLRKNSYLAVPLRTCLITTKSGKLPIMFLKVGEASFAIMRN